MKQFMFGDYILGLKFFNSIFHRRNLQQYDSHSHTKQYDYDKNKI